MRSSFPVLFTITLFISLLSACSSFTNKSSLEDADWTLHGKIAFHDLAKNQRKVASFKWQQGQGNYLIYLMNPIGQIELTLSGNEEFALAKTPDGESTTAPTAEQLLLDLTGWVFPVSATRKWITGELAGIETNVSYNDAGQATAFQYQDWQIGFERYDTFNDKTVPVKIVMHNNNFRIVFIIKGHELG